MSSTKPLIRTIHHLSCSGGTILSKCIASMTNTIVLSEVHPDHLRSDFNPYDPVQLLLAQTNLGENTELRRQIFLKRVIDAEQILRNNNMNTVLRDHTHSDYLMKMNKNEIVSRSSLIEVISENFEVCSVLSLRNPLHSYASLVHNNWNLAINSFNDYCDRVLMMLETYENLGAFIIKYEDFCKQPDITLMEVCEKLKINFSDEYSQKFHTIPMTGDSGRARGSDKIAQLEPRKFNESILKEAKESTSFNKISKLYSYEI
ncbi:hypothetical protein OAU38_00795 [Candidatus Pseudothioglobus singularis]|nr:hypothetical protein [Candidatus Pseudothioglobus singularis]